MMNLIYGFLLSDDEKPSEFTGDLGEPTAVFWIAYVR